MVTAQQKAALVQLYCYQIDSPIDVVQVVIGNILQAQLQQLLRLARRQALFRNAECAPLPRLHLYENDDIFVARD
jgi:hypothetical protein